jgi:hypothetical protein
MFITHPTKTETNDRSIRSSERTPGEWRIQHTSLNLVVTDWAIEVPCRKPLFSWCEQFALSQPNCMNSILDVSSRWTENSAVQFAWKLGHTKQLCFFWQCARHAMQMPAWLYTSLLCTQQVKSAHVAVCQGQICAAVLACLTAWHLQQQHGGVRSWYL